MKSKNYILAFAVLVLLSVLPAFGQVGQVYRPQTSKTQKTTVKKTNKTTTTTKKRTPNSSHSSSSSGKHNYSSGSSGSSSAVIEVTFNCNVEDADLYVDNSYVGSACDSYNLKTGTHNVQLVASGYEDYSSNITVSNANRSFNFKMTKISPQAIENLLEDMVFVHGGSFKMGSPDADGEFDEKPAHEVVLSSYYISKYEVTQELWQEVMGNNPSMNTGENLPVESVSWDDCQLFISKLNEITGVKFRLPTEAEWEYAARGGDVSKGYRYAGSDSIDEVAWYYNFDTASHEVGGKQPNELGIYDMSGNVLEWCSDWHGPYKAGLQKNPTGPKSGDYRVTRGGFWESESNHCSVTYRHPVSPDDVSQSIGLRLVAKSLKAKQKTR